MRVVAQWLLIILYQCPIIDFNSLHPSTVALAWLNHVPNKVSSTLDGRYDIGGKEGNRGERGYWKSVR